MDRESADLRDDIPPPFADDSVIQVGIFCCAVAMVIVLAVAVAAS